MSALRDVLVVLTVVSSALTAGLLSAYRNMALMLAVGGTLLPADFVVYVALWQVPMFLAPLAVRYLRPAPTLDNPGP